MKLSNSPNILDIFIASFCVLSAHTLKLHSSRSIYYCAVPLNYGKYFKIVGVVGSLPSPRHPSFIRRRQEPNKSLERQRLWLDFNFTDTQVQQRAGKTRLSGRGGRA